MSEPSYLVGPVDCCLCSKIIDQEGVDPCGLNIITNVDSPMDERRVQHCYCHFECYKDLIDEEELTIHPLDCCICNNVIERKGFDPCGIDIIVNVDGPTDERRVENLYCHSQCFKNAIGKHSVLYVFDPAFATIGEIEREFRSEEEE